MLGGRQDASLVETPEIFDPATGLFTPLTIVGASPRAVHTATLLTDGRVLVAGGSNGGVVPPDTEIWDIDAHTASVMSHAAIDRAGHVATLNEDGRVVITGGSTVGGGRASTGLVIDALAQTVQRDDPRRDPRAPFVASTLPPDGSAGVALDRFAAHRGSAPCTDPNAAPCWRP